MKRRVIEVNEEQLCDKQDYLLVISRQDAKI
jgi:hypothetical protein